MTRKKKDQSQLSKVVEFSPTNEYQSVSCIIDSIVKDDTILAKINEYVLRCNRIYEDTYAFIRLYSLYCYHNKVEFNFTEEFVDNCIKTLGIRDNRGKQSSNVEQLSLLQSFYQKEYQPIFNHQKYSLIGLSYFTPYISTNIFTCLSNNFKEHFFTRLERFFKILFYDYCKKNNINLKHKGNWTIFNKMINAIDSFDFNKIPTELQSLFNIHRKFVLPDTIDDILDENGESCGKSVKVDSKKNPEKYINYGIYMNAYYEEQNDILIAKINNPKTTKEEKYKLNKELIKLFQPLSLKSSFTPSYITIDTSCLLSMFMNSKTKKKTSIEEKRQIKEENKKIEKEREILLKDKKQFNKMRKDTKLEVDKIISKLSIKNRKNLSKDEIPLLTQERDKLFEQIKEYKKQIKIIRYKLFRLVPYSETFGYFQDNMIFLQRRIWNRYFKFSEKIFRDSDNFKFNFTISTDGFGCSLLFHNENCKIAKTKSVSSSYIDDYVGDENITDKDESIGTNKALYKNKSIDFKKRKIIGIDKGKMYLVYAMDEDGNCVTYTANQRNVESLSKRNKRILLTEKRKHKIIESETELSVFCSKTVNYEKFKAYLKKRHEIGKKVRPFYENILIRKLKMRTKIYRRKSEDKFINRMKNTFGNSDDCVVVIGDWGKGKQTMMKHHQPTLGSGINKIISRHFPSFLVHEAYTSQISNICGHEIKNAILPLKNKDGKIENKEIHRLVRCDECHKKEQQKLKTIKSKVSNTNISSSESEKSIMFNGGRYLTRDKNSALNMIVIAKALINENKRPECYKHKKEEEQLQLIKNNESTSVSSTQNIGIKA